MRIAAPGVGSSILHRRCDGSGTRRLFISTPGPPASSSPMSDRGYEARTLSHSHPAASRGTAAGNTFTNAKASPRPSERLAEWSIGSTGCASKKRKGRGFLALSQLPPLILQAVL